MQENQRPVKKNWMKPDIELISKGSVASGNVPGHPEGSHFTHIHPHYQSFPFPSGPVFMLTNITTTKGFYAS